MIEITQLGLFIPLLLPCPVMSSLHSNRYRTLIRRLKEARKRAGLTQVQVARLLGKPQSFVSKIEQCERRLDPIELLDIARLYKARISDLLRDLGDPSPGEKHERARRQNRRNRGGFAEKGD
jgi:transcriptional regulator with XRE-family HTH domain